MGVHLPDQHLGVVDGGETLAADTGEAHGVAFVEHADAFKAAAEGLPIPS